MLWIDSAREFATAAGVVATVRAASGASAPGPMYADAEAAVRPVIATAPRTEPTARAVVARLRRGWRTARSARRVASIRVDGSFGEAFLRARTARDSGALRVGTKVRVCVAFLDGSPGLPERNVGDD